MECWAKAWLDLGPGLNLPKTGFSLRSYRGKTLPNDDLVGGKSRRSTADYSQPFNKKDLHKAY